IADRRKAVAHGADELLRIESGSGSQSASVGPLVILIKFADITWIHCQVTDCCALVVYLAALSETSVHQRGPVPAGRGSVLRFWSVFGFNLAKGQGLRAKGYLISLAVRSCTSPTIFPSRRNNTRSPSARASS